jgi:hypothetical protein
VRRCGANDLQQSKAPGCTLAGTALDLWANLKCDVLVDRAMDIYGIRESLVAMT